MEITSPGCLPAFLAPKMLRDGVVFLRNPFLFYWASKGILPCLGLGIGIRRALSVWPDIQFNEDVENNRFTAVVSRRAGKASRSEVTGGSEIGAPGSEKGALGSEMGSEKGALGSEIGSEKGTEGSEIGIGSSEKILEIIRKDPTSSARDIANQLQISSRAVEKHLASLRQKGAIYRIGPARGGSWGLR